MRLCWHYRIPQEVEKYEWLEDSVADTEVLAQVVVVAEVAVLIVGVPVRAAALDPRAR